ncbi:UDP-glucuronic acid decarboxylase 1 [Orobanche gracilis]
MGTFNMLGLAKRIGVRFLLTSTSEVYEDPLEHPQKETYWERSCYDEWKRTAETLAIDYHRGARVEVHIARIFNTYGPRMCLDDGRVFSNFVSQAIRKHPMTVYGDGKQTRSFQYVSDLFDGLMALMEGERVGPVNLGNPGEFTMLELAEVCNYDVFREF